MMVTSISPNDLWSEYKRMRPKNFYNLRLGKPFAPSTGSITKTLIFDRCINDTHVKEFTGSGYFLGADQGNDIHAVVGKVVNGVLRIVHLEVIPFDQGFNRLHELMEAYKIKKAVIDALPNRHSANDFSKSYRGRKVVVAFYSQIDNTYREDPSDNKVDINRSISFDYLFEKIRDGGIWLYGSKTNLSSELRLAVSHLSSMRRDEVSSETRLGGQKIDIAWINTGPDHFAHAINYLNIAADLGGYDRGFKARPVMSSQEEQRLPPLRAAEVNNSRMPLGKALRGIAR
jgi:hypothetical protein